MATHESLSALFTAIADAIRAKTGRTDAIVADNFPTEISNMSAGLRVNSISTSGQYDTAAGHGESWASIDDNGNLLLVVTGGTSTSYESVRFVDATLPDGVALVNQSYYSYTSMTAGKLYVAVYSGVTSSVDIALEFASTSTLTGGYVNCNVTITAV